MAKWLKASKKRQKEDIRNYIPVHGKILHTLPNTGGGKVTVLLPHRSQDKLATMRQPKLGVWIKSAELEGKKEGRELEIKAPASRYSKGLRRKAVVHSQLDITVGETGGKENIISDSALPVSERASDPAISLVLVSKGMQGKAEKETKSKSKRRKTSQSHKSRAIHFHPPSCLMQHPHRRESGDSLDAEGDHEWLSSRSPRYRQPLHPVNISAPPQERTSTIHAVGTRKRSCDKGRSPLIKPCRPTSGDKKTNDAKVLVHMQGHDCSQALFNNNSLLQWNNRSHFCPVQPEIVHKPDVEQENTRLDGLLSQSDSTNNSSYLSWLDAGLPSEYQLPSSSSLSTSELNCDTNALLEELSYCEKAL